MTSLVGLTTLLMFWVFVRFSLASDCLHYWRPLGFASATVLRRYADVRDISCLRLPHGSGDSVPSLHRLW